MRAAIYARYSSERQNETSLDDQYRECESYAEKEGLRVVKRYSDAAISGATLIRPQFQQMMIDAKAGEFDTLLLFSSSRLGRDEVEIPRVLRELTYIGIRVVGVSNGYDNSRAGHRWQSGIESIANAYYIEEVSKQTFKSMYGKAEKGYSVGGKIYGYYTVPIEDPDKPYSKRHTKPTGYRYVVDEEQAEVVKRIFKFYSEGRSCRWIAGELNRQGIPSPRNKSWGASTIYGAEKNRSGILNNEAYIGKLVWNKTSRERNPETGKPGKKQKPQSEWIICQAPEMAIISKTLWNKVKAMQTKRSHESTNPTARATYLFSGLLKCSECGSSFVITHSNKKAWNRYGCSGHKDKGDSHCSNSLTVSRRIVEENLLSYIKETLMNEDLYMDFRRESTALLKEHGKNNEAELAKKKLRSLEGKIDNLMSAIEAGIITDATKARLQELENEHKSLKHKIDNERKVSHSLARVLPNAAEKYRTLVAKLEDSLLGHVDSAREILRSVYGDRILMIPDGDHLKAGVSMGTEVLLKRIVGINDSSLQCDAGGRSGPRCQQSHYIPLIPKTGRGRYEN